MRPAACIAGLLCTVGAATPAAADLVVLATGRSMSVASHRMDADRILLTLHGGGEVACDLRLIVRIVPDEVPPVAPIQADGSQMPGDAATPEGDVPFGNLIEPLAARHGVDAALVRAVVEAESAYQPNARSRRGAVGLMQLMPETIRQYAVGDPFDPAQNLSAGIRHLRRLLDRFELPLALAAYNAGEGAVARYGGVPPFRETRAYVASVLMRARGGGNSRASTTSRPVLPATKDALTRS